MDNQLASLYSSLLHILDEELRCHQHLLEVINEETQVLRNSRLTEILEISAAKEDAFHQSEAATQKRVESVERIITHMGIEVPVAFVHLAAHADAATRQILTGYREKFADIIHHIEKTNEINRQMITLTLAHINKNITFINNISSTISNYDHQGQMKAGNLQGRLISRAG